MNEGRRIVPTRRIMVAVSIALLVSVATMNATAFSSSGPMNCDIPANGQSIQYSMFCETDGSDCSSKQLFVGMSAFFSGEDATWVNYEIDWDDGTFTSAYQYNSANFFSQTWIHTYAENGTYHPKIYLENAFRSCSHTGETLSMP